jgi:predicted DNA-binding transcriptional regulator AlpA
VLAIVPFNPSIFNAKRPNEALNMNSIDPLLKDGEAATMLSCSKSTLWRRVADGTVPRPVKIGGMSRWLQSEIKAVIEHAITQRDAGHASTRREAG